MNKENFEVYDEEYTAIEKAKEEVALALNMHEVTKILEEAGISTVQIVIVCTSQEMDEIHEPLTKFSTTVQVEALDDEGDTFEITVDLTG